MLVILVLYFWLFCLVLIPWGMVLPYIVYFPWDTLYPSKPAPSLVGLFSSLNCSGPNQLQARLYLPPGLNLNAATRTACHYPRYCSTEQSSLNATFLNASFLSLQGFSASNCSGNVTYSTDLVLPSASGGLEGCLVHASGSALFLPNYNDPEATPLPSSGWLRFISKIMLYRVLSLLFLLLLLCAACGRRVELVDEYKVELEPWEMARAASSSPIYLAAALALFAAAQALFAADYFVGDVFNNCKPQTLDSPYYWYWLSYTAELAAGLALILHLQLARLARDGFCFGGCVYYTLFVLLILPCTRGQRYSPKQRPQRLPCTVSISAAALAVVLCCVISAATNLAPALAQPAGLNPTSRALVLAGTGILCCALALLAWGCWVSRGVTGVGCQRGLLVALQSEPSRYASPQDFSLVEFIWAHLWATLKRGWGAAVAVAQPQSSSCCTWAPWTRKLAWPPAWSAGRQRGPAPARARWRVACTACTTPAASAWTRRALTNSGWL